MSPLSRPGWRLPVVPTRMKVSTPILISSSTTMAAEGQPIPVEQALTPTPPASPV